MRNRFSVCFMKSCVVFYFVFIHFHKICIGHLNKVRPTWWHLLYYVNFLLNMFRMLIHPSSGACDYLVLYCVGCNVLTWGVLVLCSGIGCWWCGIRVQAALSAGWTTNVVQLALGYHITNSVAVGIATRYGLDGPGIVSWCGRDFPHPSRHKG